MTKSPKYDLTALLAPVAEAIAHKHKNTSRESMFDRYMAEPYENDAQLKSRKKSTFKSTEVSDVVEALFAEAMEQFASDDALIEFSPVGPDDVDKAREETSVINHLFKEQNDSFVTLSTWFKSGLIEQNAYARSGWEEKTRVIIDEYEDLTIAQFMQVYNSVSDADAYEIEKLEGATVDEDGNVTVTSETGEIHTRIRSERSEKKYVIEAIPESEFFISPRWNKVGLDDCPAYGHKARKSISELVAMGFDRKSLEELQSGDDDQGKTNRHNTETNDDGYNENSDLVTVCEAYVMANDHGAPRLLRCWVNEDGKTPLRWENGDLAIDEVERGPFSAWTPYIVPHRHVGRSVAELAMTRQRLNTSLWRNLIDNMAATNNVRPVISEGDVTKDTYEDLLDSRPGAPIRTQNPGGVTWTNPPQIIGDVLTVLDRVDGDLEKHAGAVRYAQGLAPNALEKTNIGSEGMGRIMDAAQRRMNVVIRTFAETGLRDLFTRMHADMRRGPSKDLALQINGEWVETSPLEWRDRTDMTVRIGTGRADGERRLMALQSVLAEQKEHIAQGSPMVTVQHLFETYKRMARLLGLQSIEPFMQDPAQLPPEPEKDPAQDPAMVLAMAEQAKAEADMVEARTKQQIALADINFQAQKLQLESQIAQAKAREAEAMLQLRAAEVGIKGDKVQIDALKVMQDG